MNSPTQRTSLDYTQPCIPLSAELSLSQTRPHIKPYSLTVSPPLPPPPNKENKKHKQQNLHTTSAIVQSTPELPLHSLTTTSLSYVRYSFATTRLSFNTLYTRARPGRRRQLPPKNSAAVSVTGWTARDVRLPCVLQRPVSSPADAPLPACLGPARPPSPCDPPPRLLSGAAPPRDGGLGTTGSPSPALSCGDLAGCLCCSKNLCLSASVTVKIVVIWLSVSVCLCYC